MTIQLLARKFLRPVPFKQMIGRRAFSSQMAADVGQPTPATHPQIMKDGELTPGITTDEYISRRHRLLELLPEKSLAILAAAPVKMMTDVVPYTFRQDADYLYITGCQQPGGIAILGREWGLCMFMPEAKPHDVLWQGQIAGVEAATAIFKADRSYPLSKLPKILPDMIRQSSKLFHNVNNVSPGYTILEAYQILSSNGKVEDLSKYTHQLRWKKSTAELNLMRQSASIACQALLLTIMHSSRHRHESMLSAKIEYECRMRGAQRMAFNPVVGGGSNGTVIHYSRNDQIINDGDLVLMDVGCELHGYASDITRTWPPSGSFTSAQEQLYHLILETNKESVKLCRPGTTIRDIHKYSVEMLYQGFKEIGLLKEGRNNSLVFNQLNPTSIGHYLGMDVHDCSTITYDRPLEPGVVITIEPGVYIPTNFDCPERYRGTGIRIEDDILITESGHEVITGSVPKEVKHLEKLLNSFSGSTPKVSCDDLKVACH
ncbi:hypothetical protein MLD38_020712 [Melastoma candidum]|uniref:Uncharacterized protein n=1 Tax=Melastoma candidum TaxID=119954 RepID=A0ACB9QD66_9MYRT|nr:hypothetical protein MLD38_020712 [Melastoma candidum]